MQIPKWKVARFVVIQKASEKAKVLQDLSRPERLYRFIRNENGGHVIVSRTHMMHLAENIRKEPMFGFKGREATDNVTS